MVPLHASPLNGSASYSKQAHRLCFARMRWLRCKRFAIGCCGLMAERSWPWAQAAMCWLLTKALLIRESPRCSLTAQALIPGTARQAQAFAACGFGTARKPGFKTTRKVQGAQQSKQSKRPKQQSRLNRRYGLTWANCGRLRSRQAMASGSVWHFGKTPCLRPVWWPSPYRMSKGDA